MKFKGGDMVAPSSRCGAGPWDELFKDGPKKIESVTPNLASVVSGGPYPYQIDEWWFSDNELVKRSLIVKKSPKKVVKKTAPKKVVKKALPKKVIK